jgi:protoporphyrinogen oxidase
MVMTAAPDQARGSVSDQAVDAVVIGGGMSGLGAAAALARDGRSVVVVEAAAGIGGLARELRVGGEPIEAYYHHIFPQDHETRVLIDRLGLTTRLEWHKAPMAVLHKGKVFGLDSPMDVLRFSPLAASDRVRMAGATLVQIARRDQDRLDRTSVSIDGRRWFGSGTYDTLWKPLLEAKFGPYASDVPMAWLVSRIRQRSGGREATGDRLGYLRGSLGSLAGAFAGRLQADGVDIRTSSRVMRLNREVDQWVVDVVGPNGPQRLRAPAVIACVSGSLLGRLVELPAPYAAAMRAIPYRGVVCVLLELSRPISRYYWVSVTDPLGLGCVGIIEHTNFIPAARYGGRSLVYLAHYVEFDGPTWNATADELIDAVLPAIRALNPTFSRDWIEDVHVSRDPFAQPVPQVGGPMPGLPVETGLPGLYHASLAHVYPDDRGVSRALAMGQRAVLAAGQSVASAATASIAR